MTNFQQRTTALEHEISSQTKWEETEAGDLVSTQDESCLQGDDSSLKKQNYHLGGFNKVKFEHLKICTNHCWSKMENCAEN